MSLQLSPRSVKEFYGAVVDTMPVLISGMKDGQQVDIAREIMPINFFYHQRVNGQEPFKTAFRDNYFFTAAGAAKSREGNHKWDLRSPLLRDTEVVNCNNLSIGAARISDERYEAISGTRVKTVKKDEVAALHGKGYVRKEGTDLFVPANDQVEAFHDFLNQNRINLAEYAGTVAEETSRKYGKTNQVMTLYFDQANHGSAVVRSVVVYRADLSSLVFGCISLDDSGGRLGGVAPEALDAFDNVNLGTVDVRNGPTRKGLEDALRERR